MGRITHKIAIKFYVHRGQRASDCGSKRKFETLPTDKKIKQRQQITQERIQQAEKIHKLLCYRNKRNESSLPCYRNKKEYRRAFFQRCKHNLLFKLAQSLVQGNASYEKSFVKSKKDRLSEVPSLVI